jgi:hypothetical protein
MDENVEIAPTPLADVRLAFGDGRPCSPESLWCAARTRWLGDDGCTLCREEAAE